MMAASVLLLVSLAYMALLGYAASRPRNAVTVYFMLMLAISVAWDITYYLELIIPSFEGKVISRLVRFLFLPWLSMIWVLMTCRLFNLGAWLPRLLWPGIAALNAVTVLIAVTSLWHEWFIYDFQIQTFGSVGILFHKDGAWYRFYLLYQNLLALFGFGLLAGAWPAARGIRRNNLTLLILGFSVPLVMNLFFSVGKSPVSHINLAPFTTVISIAAFSWVVLRNRVLDIVPLARGLLPDVMEDWVLVTDTKGTVVDLNVPCRRALGIEPGQATNSLPSPWREAFGMETGLIDAMVENQSRWFEVSTLDVKDGHEVVVGRLHVWRDVTERVRREAERVELERAKADARLIGQQKRLLRDMHDGVGGIAAHISLLAGLGRQEPESGSKDKIFDTIETLAAEGNAEIRRMMNAMERRNYLWTDWLLEVRKYAQAACTGKAIELVSFIEGSPPEGELSLPAGMSLFRVMKEAINNVVKHSGANRVELRMGFSDLYFELVIQDNGRGFDLDTVRRGRGLNNMRRRTEELGGEMSLSNSNGMRCGFRIPVPIKYPVEELEQAGGLQLNVPS